MSAMRAKTILCLGLALGLVLGPEVGRAGPRKSYQVQDPVYCHTGAGCPRLLSIAVRHARAWCTSEGGVKVGGQKSDYRCEQRGMQCVVSGEIECQGRVDPRAAPGRPGVEKPAFTCLDPGCRTRLDPGPGRQEQGVHACADLVCARLGFSALESQLHSGSRRGGLLACPAGLYLRGASWDRSVLLCSRAERKPGRESLVEAEPLGGLLLCDALDAETPRVVTAIAADGASILCAPID
jgi:hypothetical protein